MQKYFIVDGFRHDDIKNWLGAVNMVGLQSCGPCDCEQYGYRVVYNVTSERIQRWLNQANEAGEYYGINPVVFLAIASVESNGDFSAVNPQQTSYGIVQIQQDHVEAFNCYHGTLYKVTDLIGKGPNIWSANSAVKLSFQILGEYLKELNHITKAIKLTSTGWNGAICGYTGSFEPHGKGCGYWPIPTSPSCYGEAVYKLCSAFDPWWINPASGKPSSFYFNKLSPAPFDVLPAYNQVCLGP